MTDNDRHTIRMAETEHKDHLPEKIIYWASWIALIAAFAVLCYYVRMRSLTIVDSDLSSELILAKMLREENSILTKNWYYGTELRILYITQIFAVLFRFTDNWYLVRVYGEIIMFVILLLSVWFFSCSFGIKRRFPMLGCALIIPFSGVYFKFALTGAYYIPCIAISFIGLSLMIRFIRCTDPRKRILLLAASALLAYVSSLIGFRQIVMFYLPVTMGAVLPALEHKFKDGMQIKGSPLFWGLVVTGTDLMASAAGCLVNSGLLIRIYHVKDWNDLSFTRFKIESVIDSICGIVRNIGYSESKMTIRTIISNGYAVLLFAVCIFFMWRGYKKRKEFSAEYLFLYAYLLCALLVFVLLYSLTDMVYYDLYSLPIAVFLFPVFIVGVEELSGNGNSGAYMRAAWLVLALIVSLGNYRALYKTDSTIQQRDITAYLLENDYHNGYGTFWNANIITELSNGVIDMYAWEDNEMLNTVEDVDSVHEWLQKVSHSTKTPEGKVFLIYNESRHEIYDCNWKDNLKDEDIIYRTEDFVLYGYESHEEMRRILMNDGGSADNG